MVLVMEITLKPSTQGLTVFELIRREILGQIQKTRLRLGIKHSNTTQGTWSHIWNAATVLVPLVKNKYLKSEDKRSAIREIL